jgi:hypothetical protein
MKVFDEQEMIHYSGLFGSVVAVAFQIAFRAKMHVNDFFLKKNHF